MNVFINLNTYMWACDTSSASAAITDGDEKFFIERFKLINNNSKGCNLYNRE